MSKIYLGDTFCLVPENKSVRGMCMPDGRLVLRCKGSSIEIKPEHFKELVDCIDRYRSIRSQQV